MENKIYQNEKFIVGISEKFDAKPHKHPVLEIYMALDGNSHVEVNGKNIEGQIIIIGQDAIHCITDTKKKGLVIFIDLLSEYGYSLKENLLRNNDYSVITNNNIKKIILELTEDFSENTIIFNTYKIIKELNNKIIKRPFNKIILNIIEIIKKEEQDFTMDTLASKLHFSKSYIAHIFSEQTGITLKSYLQYKRMEESVRQIIKGKKITEIAYKTGFSSSSHIATSSIKITGLQLKKLLNI